MRAAMRLSVLMIATSLSANSAVGELSLPSNGGALTIGPSETLTMASQGAALAIGANGSDPALPPLPTPAAFLIGHTSIGGTLDINNNAVIFSDSLLDEVNGWIRTGHIVSAWADDGDTAAGYDRFGIGAVRNGDFDVMGLEPSKTSPFWAKPVTDECIFVRATYNGDANLDGVVDCTDYQYWLEGSRGGSGVAGWMSGDFNYDGITDSQDLAILQANGVPEPSTLALLGIGGLAVLTWGWRRRK